MPTLHEESARAYVVRTLLFGMPNQERPSPERVTQSANVIAHLLKEQGATDFASLPFDDVHRALVAVDYAHATLSDVLRLAATLSTRCGAFGDTPDPQAEDPLAAIVEAYRAEYGRSEDMAQRRSRCVRITQQQLRAAAGTPKTGAPMPLEINARVLTHRLYLQWLDFRNLGQTQVQHLIVGAHGKSELDDAVAVVARLAMSSGAFGHRANAERVEQVTEVEALFREAVRVYPGLNAGRTSARQGPLD